MKGVDTIARIRREHFVRGRSIKELSRELHISRNTVRKILCSNTTEFKYEPEIQLLRALKSWQLHLDELLLANEGKPSRQQLTLVRRFEHHRDTGFQGSYNAVRKYSKKWVPWCHHGSSLYPALFCSGGVGAYQFD